MEHDFWHNRWAEGRIGFHQAEFNTYLLTYWNQLAVSGGQVLVPLCGKSRDMLWMREMGHSVIGVELSKKACREFFLEQQADADVRELGDFTAYQQDQITLMCGDFFALRSEQVEQVVAVYDRAALIALPPEMRQSYAQHLCRILPLGVQLLLVTLSFDGDEGPPFSVREDEVTALFSERFDIRLLHTEVWSEGKDQGRSEQVYCLSDKSKSA